MKTIDLQFDETPIRCIIKNDNQVWFPGIDVCKILGYAMPSNVIKDNLDDDERELTNLPDWSGQKRKTWTINESGLYSLILSSTKPEAKVFKRWITHEVLPAIRKAGMYTTDQVKNKQLRLQELRKLIDTKKASVMITKSSIKQLESEIAELDEEFWDIFNTNPDQLKLFTPEQEKGIEQ